ncbi:MAG: putative anti-sigma regulatory factor, serine/threonine protein kinase [Solirubrobacterales bacterium]|nr:putative anti-sigma regulatory factor, serine/threonine protein kinase [Solirubrobacterales bacterium]
MPDSMTISSRVECIDDARRWVAERAQTALVHAGGTADLELALTEALANVIEHSYAGQGAHEIRVGTEVTEDVIRVTVRDWGRIADARTFVRRDLDDPGEGGYGVFLMEQLVDDVRRELPPDGGTLLTLTKYLRTPNERRRS